jgi:uncharacterized membrane protein
MKDISPKRHLAKTFTWRITATATTIMLAWIISGDPMIGLQVGGYEFFIKMALYYLHERMWYKVKFGVKESNDE